MVSLTVPGFNITAEILKLVKPKDRTLPFFHPVMNLAGEILSILLTPPPPLPELLLPQTLWIKPAVRWAHVFLTEYLEQLRGLPYHFLWKNPDRVKCPHWPILLSDIWAGNCDLTPRTPLQGAVWYEEWKRSKTVMLFKHDLLISLDPDFILEVLWQWKGMH